MEQNPEKILSDAMNLDAEGRTFLVEALLESLDPKNESTLSPEWKREIQQRCAEVDRGEARLLNGDSVMDGLRNKYT